MYIYPDNLKAAPMLFLWRLKDLTMIGIGALIAVFAMAQTGFTIPLIATIVYGFLAIRFEDTSILDFIKYAVTPAVRKLLEQDAQHLDHIQAMTATAREFLLIVRIRGLKDKEIFSYLNRIEKTLNENGFSARKYAGEDIKTLLAVYFEQNVTTEKFENADGERWILNG